MNCQVCGNEFELTHFNQKICSPECKKKARQITVNKYKKSDRGKLANERWIKSDRRIANEKRYMQKPRAKHLAVLRAKKCLKNSPRLRERKRKIDNAYGKTPRGRETNNKASRKYRQTERGRQANKNGKARRRQRENKGRITMQEWNDKLIECNNSCVICGSTENIEQDHIIPLSKGGKHDISNIQPLCKSCNRKKGVKIL